MPFQEFLPMSLWLSVNIPDHIFMLHQLSSNNTVESHNTVSCYARLSLFLPFLPLCVLYPCWSSDFSVMVVLGHDFTLTHIGYSHITPPTTTRSQTMSLSFKFPHLLRHLMGFPCLVFLMSIAFLFAVQTHRQAGTVDTTHR